MASLLVSPESPCSNTYLDADAKQYSFGVNLVQDGEENGLDLPDLDPA
jgi:hypothetical protein